MGEAFQVAGAADLKSLESGRAARVIWAQEARGRGGAAGLEGRQAQALGGL